MNVDRDTPSTVTRQSGWNVTLNTNDAASGHETVASIRDGWTCSPS